MMFLRVHRLSLASLLAVSAFSASAQGMRTPGSAAAQPPVPSVQVPLATGVVTGTQRPADYIVAVVNSEPITNYQVRLEAQRITRQLAQQQQPVPDARILMGQSLERLINERAQLHFARESGIKIDEGAIDDAMQSVARQNQVDEAELLRRLALDGIDRAGLRKQLRDQLTLTRVRDREVLQKVRITELDINRYLREQQEQQNGAAAELNLAQVLVALPEDATPAQVAAGQEKAQRVLDNARAGEDFAKLAREQSNATDAAAGGQMGLRSAERYPTLFVEATQSTPVGGLVLVRSGAGFHVLKVLDKRFAGMPATTTVQTRASHILLRLTPELTEAAARERLNDFRARIVAGSASFAALAQQNSQDGSAAQGGDLGWAAPGQFVPEFEDVMNTLAPGDVSQPLLSRFGMHLIQVRERRTVQLGQREQREAVRAILREKKTDEMFGVWGQELRARAYVEMREPPG